MPLIYLVGILIVVGVVLALINNYVPMDQRIKNLINTVVVIGVVIWLLSVFGVLDYVTRIQVPKF